LKLYYRDYFISETKDSNLRLAHHSMTFRLDVSQVLRSDTFPFTVYS